MSPDTNPTSAAATAATTPQNHIEGTTATGTTASTTSKDSKLAAGVGVPQVPAALSINDLTADQLEILFDDTLRKCNQLSKETDATEQVIMAKMINSCIRMLHAENWIPRTIIRAMVLRELEPEMRITAIMRQAFRERKAEMLNDRRRRDHEYGQAYYHSAPSGVDGVNGQSHI